MVSMFAGRGSAFGEVLGVAITLVQPGCEHTLQERRRQSLACAHPESGAPPLDIDLDAGVVRIYRAPVSTPQE